VVSDGRPVEAKSCGVFWPVQERWGDPGTDEVPDRVVLQAQVHLAVTGSDVCHVPALFWGLKQELYQVERDDKMLGDLLDFLTVWWEQHVLKGEPPEVTETPSMDVLKRVRREPASVVDLSENPDIEKLVFEWQQAGLHKAQDEQEQEECKAQIVTLLGDAEAGQLADGRLVVFLEQSFGPKVRAKDLQLEQPEVFKKYGYESRGRVLRVKQAKKEKFDLNVLP
jgi:predicted phage-related endonuclease